ncbi:MAG TPA: hypothetical protein VFN78_05325 [Ktedonobacterales bacterium]|nr:hypothetical protein [Ktedonobacterales bacterium]
MRSDIIPPNRAITVVLIIGMLALIAYGAYNRDPATIVIIAALFIFFAMPALLLYSLNRRARQRPPEAATPTDSVDHRDER